MENGNRGRDGDGDGGGGGVRERDRQTDIEALGSTGTQRQEGTILVFLDYWLLCSVAFPFVSPTKSVTSLSVTSTL